MVTNKYRYANDAGARHGLPITLVRPIAIADIEEVTNRLHVKMAILTESRDNAGRRA